MDTVYLLYAFVLNFYNFLSEVFAVTLKSKNIHSWDQF